MRVFLSHSSADETKALAICERVEQAGHTCFYAPRDIRSGYEYAEELVNGIDNSDAMLLLLSENANKSPHVLREVERAVSKKIAIIVYKLENVELSKSMEYFLMTHQWINAKSDRGYDDIVACLNQLSQAHGENAAQPAAGETAAESTQAAKAVNVNILDDADKSKGDKKRKCILAVVFAASAIVAIAAVAIGFGNAVTGGDESSVSDSSTVSDVSSEQDNSVADTTSAATTSQPEQTSAISTTVQTTTIPEDTTAQQEAQPDSEPAAIVELGDTITIGTYLDNAIEWRVIEISDDGKSAMLLAQNILTMKAYDAAEGGKYNFSDGEYYWNVPPADVTPELERLIRGDNRWENSNIRLWLNSDRENVQYIGQAPTAQAMSELKNGYQTEAGFLKSFTDEERAAILTTKVITNGNVTEDKVFLLSSDELELLYRADVSKYAYPTDAAVQQDTSRWFELNQNDFGIMDHCWWLRDANTDTASECYLINNSYSSMDMFSASVGLEGYGIRPVMTVDLTALNIGE